MEEIASSITEAEVIIEQLVSANWLKGRQHAHIWLDGSPV